MKTCLLPWLDEFCDGENFREMLLEDKDKERPFYPNGWLEALERSEEERKAVILENIEKFKLPKKLAIGVLEAEGK